MALYYYLLRVLCDLARDFSRRAARPQSFWILLCELSVFPWRISAFKFFIFRNRNECRDLGTELQKVFLSVVFASSLCGSLRLNSSFLFTAEGAEIYAKGAEDLFICVNQRNLREKEKLPADSADLRRWTSFQTCKLISGRHTQKIIVYLLIKKIPFLREAGLPVREAGYFRLSPRLSLAHFTFKFFLSKNLVANFIIY